MSLIKICGLRDSETAIAAVAGGASMLGFVFYPKSPRAVTPDAAEEIVTEVKQAAYDGGFDLPKTVGVFVDAGEQLLAETAPFLTYFQFHGTETPERVASMGAEFGMETIKALAISGPEDVARADEFADCADMLLFDSAAPKNADRPGGHGTAFDWSVLKSYAGDVPWLLAGGLTPETVKAAIAATKAIPGFSGVDVSSGVERAPGEKDLDQVARFIRAARASMDGR